MNSILISIKKLIGLTEQDESFDIDVILHINMAFATLASVGVGPKGFRIVDETTEWEEFTDDPEQLGLVKDYVYFKTKLAFDPPTSSNVLEAMNKTASELEWRLHVHEDNYVFITDSKEGEIND